MPSVNLHLSFPDAKSSSDPPTATNASLAHDNPLPTLLRTPSGLAILEVQGTVHAPFPQANASTLADGNEVCTDIGRLEFPLYDPTRHDSGESGGEGKWMKKVYLYAGKHQRLTGEVKKLAKPLGLVTKVVKNREEETNNGEEEAEEVLEMVDVVRYKIMFAGRPEPVGGE